MRWFRRGLSRLGFGGSGFPCPDLRVFRLCFFVLGSEMWALGVLEWIRLVLRVQVYRQYELGSKVTKWYLLSQAPSGNFGALGF